MVQLCCVMRERADGALRRRSPIFPKYADLIWKNAELLSGAYSSKFRQLSNQLDLFKASSIRACSNATSCWIEGTWMEMPFMFD